MEQQLLETKIQRRLSIGDGIFNKLRLCTSKMGFGTSPLLLIFFLEADITTLWGYPIISTTVRCRKEDLVSSIRK